MNIPDPIERMLESIRRKSDAFEAELAALPSSRPCERHTGSLAVLLVDLSWQEARPVYGCPECADDKRRSRRERRMMNAGIPVDVQHATIENFDSNRPNVNPAFQTPSQFVQAACKFDAGEARNLILAGKPGVGKGHLAAALAIKRLDSGESVAWIDCAGLFTAYHQAYRDNSTDDVIARYGNAGLTVLDEICLRDLPSDGEEILFAILDRRHKAGLSTILLSNQIAEKVKTWLGGRIYDRLKSGGCLFRYGEWESMRGKQKDGASDEF